MYLNKTEKSFIPDLNTVPPKHEHVEEDDDLSQTLAIFTHEHTRTTHKGHHVQSAVMYDWCKCVN